jgi:hypothetical protein
MDDGAGVQQPLSYGGILPINGTTKEGGPHRCSVANEQVLVLQDDWQSFQRTNMRRAFAVVLFRLEGGLTCGLN